MKNKPKQKTYYKSNLAQEEHLKFIVLQPNKLPLTKYHVSIIEKTFPL